MVFNRLSERLKGYGRLPPEDEAAKKDAKAKKRAQEKEKAELKAVRREIAGFIEAFVREFGRQILPERFLTKVPARLSVLRSEISTYTVNPSHLSIPDHAVPHIQVRGLDLRMRMMSYNPHQEPVLTLTLYEKDELFAGPRQIGYCLDRDGVLKSEKGLTSFARGELGTRPVVEAFAFGTFDNNIWHALDPEGTERKAKWAVTLDEKSIPDKLRHRIARSFTVDFDTVTNPQAHVPGQRDPGQGSASAVVSAP